jgi:glycosyltransferase involved in cell wall biosynthesis
VKLLFADPSQRLGNIHELDHSGRGGMLASLFRVSDYLASRGHTVHVLANITQPGVTPAGADWRVDPDPPYDVLIGNRGMGYTDLDLPVKARILWTHDLPHHGFGPNPQAFRAVHVVFMSRFASRIWRAFFPAIRRWSIIPNGVDRTLFYPGQHDPMMLLYCSAPDRGLDRLPGLHEALQAKLGPSVQMVAYSNLKKQHPGEVRETDPYETVYEAVDASTVERHDPIPQAKLAQVMRTAGVLLMPTACPEICSNNILQALASGLPVISTDIGSAGEWIRDGRNGALIPWTPQDGVIYSLSFLRRLLAMMTARQYHRMSARAANTSIWSWDDVGRAWEKLCYRII